MTSRKVVLPDAFGPINTWNGVHRTVHVPQTAEIERLDACDHGLTNRPPGSRSAALRFLLQGQDAGTDRLLGTDWLRLVDGVVITRFLAGYGRNRVGARSCRSSAPERTRRLDLPVAAAG